MRSEGIRAINALGRLIVMGAMGLALTACANIEPFEYTPSSEIPPGPGLFTGEDGAFTFSRPYDSAEGGAAATNIEAKRAKSN